MAKKPSRHRQYVAKSLPIRVRPEERAEIDALRASLARELKIAVSHTDFYRILLASWQEQKGEAS